eukprot:s2147_g13.t2
MLSLIQYPRAWRWKIAMEDAGGYDCKKDQVDKLFVRGCALQVVFIESGMKGKASRHCKKFFARPKTRQYCALGSGVCGGVWLAPHFDVRR